MSNNVDNNGPAFPTGSYEFDGDGKVLPFQHDGMTLREFFAAHAPAEPQPWFEPTMLPRPVPPADDLRSVLPDCTEDEDREAQSWRRDPCYDLCTKSPRLAPYERAWEDYWRANHAWSEEKKRQRYVQWPWAWADAVLAARGGKA